MYAVVIIYLCLAVLLFTVLIPDPRMAGLRRPTEDQALSQQTEQETPLVSERSVADSQGEAPLSHRSEETITWTQALCAPKVLLYAGVYFGIKFSIYAFLLWMPLILGK